MVKQRARRVEPAPGPDTLILRGLPMTRENLRENAQDNHDMYGFYGVSVFRTDTPDETDTVLTVKLGRFQRVAAFRGQALLDQGLDLWATGATPHYDVVRGPEGADLDTLIDLMLATTWTELHNEHFMEGEER